MSNVLKMLSRGGADAAADTDPNFKQTVLLLHGDGTNGAQNNTFLDSSTNNFTITRNGNTTQGTFSPFSVGAGEWGNYFDGTGDWLTIPSNAAFQFGTGDFTIECWINKATAANGPIIDARGSSTAAPYAVYVDGSNFPYFYDGAIYTSSVAITNNQWNHVAVVRTSGTLKIFVNGVQGYSNTVTTSLNPSSTIFIGGQNFSTPVTMTGYISNLRVVKGTAVYTSAFTPSTTPLTAISGTSLLTCQSNRFVDNSTNAFAITRNGDVRVTPFSPFAPTAAYSAGTNGGSGYFDGTGDFIQSASSATAFDLSSGDWTVETWVYLNAYTAIGSHLIGLNNASTNSGFNLYILASGAITQDNGVTATSNAGNVPLNAWTHIAAVRSSGATRLYINGTDVGLNITQAPNSGTFVARMGSLAATAGGSFFYLNGYQSNIRIVKGQALTTGNFTPPTAPVTTSAVGWNGTNAATSLTGTTSLLLNFTNAGIIDNTGKNNLETVGNAQIDTTTKKYGTGSLEFDRVDDRLVGASPDVLTFGTGDFTVEAWVNFRSFTSGYPQLIATNTGTNGQPQFAFTSTTAYVYGPSLTTYSRSFTWALNTWYHVAFVRASGSLTIYVNGSALGTSQSMTENLVSPNFSVGAYNSGAANGMFDGFIDDLRVTRGVARYTANFTAPTKEFPDL